MEWLAGLLFFLTVVVVPVIGIMVAFHETEQDKDFKKCLDKFLQHN